MGHTHTHMRQSTYNYYDRQSATKTNIFMVIGSRFIQITVINKRA